MPTFVKGGGTAVPFGRNEFLRSTNPKPRFESHTVAASTVPSAVDANSNTVKILQPGVVLAKITSGGEVGKVGPYSVDTVGVTDGRSATANIVGLNSTFLPWQLLDRDEEVAVVYQGVAKQAWCLELKADLTYQALSNATADAMRGGKKLNVNFD